MNVYPVNKIEFRLVRSVQNEMLFQVRDIDRKPVSLPITDSLTIAITDALSETLLMTRDLILADSVKGVYQLVILPAELDTWLTGPLRWSIVHTGAAGMDMLWTDQNYTLSGSLMVTAGPLPGPAATTIVAWSEFSRGALVW